MQLETLITQLGITEHMEALSDWRDALLIEKAEELQKVHADHAENVVSINESNGLALSAAIAEKNEAVATLRSEKDGVAALEEELSSAKETIATLQSAVAGANAIIAGHVKTIQQKSAKVSELQALLDAPEKERKRLELQAQLAALDDPAPTE